jgi:hypothetical protein
MPPDSAAKSASPAVPAAGQHLLHAAVQVPAVLGLDLFLRFAHRVHVAVVHAWW